MALTIHCEETSINKLSELEDEKHFSFGIVIGQKHEDNFFVVHLAPFPSRSIPAEEDKEKKQAINTSISSVSEGALSVYARQAVRMLPGGLEIIGIYMTLPQLQLNNSATQGKIKSILTSMHKSTTKNFLDIKESTNEKIVLYCCSQSQKTGVKSMNLSEHGSLLKNGDLKVKSTKWIEIDYRYSFTCPIFFKKDKDSQSLFKNVLISLKPWIESVQEALILIDEKTLKEDHLLHNEEEKVPMKKKGNRHLMELQPPKVLQASFLEKCVTDRKISEIEETSGSIFFSGTVGGRAFLHSKATAKEAFAALKMDLVRSIVSRWEMHCDSLIEEPLCTTSQPVVHEPPRRVFLEGGGLPVSLCDYLFPGDTVADACQSAEELLSIAVSVENVDDSVETFADASQLLVGGTQDSLSCSSPERLCDEVSSVSRSNAFHFVVAILVGMIAVAISYLIITRNKPSS